jgi:hypothetical protein
MSMCDLLIMLKQVTSATVAKYNLAIPNSSTQSPGLESYQALTNSQHLQAERLIG